MQKVLGVYTVNYMGVMYVQLRYPIGACDAIPILPT